MDINFEKLDRDSLKQIKDALRKPEDMNDFLREFLLHDSGFAFYMFCKFVLGASRPQYLEMNEELHLEVCERFVSGNTREMILLPREHLKTSIAIGFALWRGLKLKDSAKICYCSSTVKYSQKCLRELATFLESNEVVRALWPEHCPTQKQVRSGKWRSVDEIHMPGCGGKSKDATFTAASVGSNIVGSHFTDMLFDDLQNFENSRTTGLIDYVNDWLNTSFAVLRPKDGKARLIGTKWAYNDIHERQMKLKLWNVMLRSATELSPGEPADIWDKRSKVIFPEKWSRRTLGDKKKQLGPYRYSCQYDNVPIAPENQVFNVDSIRYYELNTDGEAFQIIRKDENFTHTIPVSDCTVWCAVDPALSDDQDYTVVIAAAMDWEGKLYVLEYDRQHTPRPKMVVDMTFRMCRKYNIMNVGLETVAFQKTFKYAFIDEMKESNYYFRIHELKHAHRGNKEQRVGGYLEPRYAVNSIYHRDEMVELLDELTKFTWLGTRGHDDIIDALASIIEIAKPAPNPRRLYSTRNERFEFLDEWALRDKSDGPLAQEMKAWQDNTAVFNFGIN